MWKYHFVVWSLSSLEGVGLVLETLFTPKHISLPVCIYSNNTNKLISWKWWWLLSPRVIDYFNLKSTSSRSTLKESPNSLNEKFRKRESLSLQKVLSITDRNSYTNKIRRFRLWKTHGPNKKVNMGLYVS